LTVDVTVLAPAVMINFSVTVLGSCALVRVVVDRVAV
jgi:hypothetical protein